MVAEQSVISLANINMLAIKSVHYKLQESDSKGLIIMTGIKIQNTIQFVCSSRDLHDDDGLGYRVKI